MTGFQSCVHKPLFSVMYVMQHMHPVWQYRYSALAHLVLPIHLNTKKQHKTTDRSVAHICGYIFLNLVFTYYLVYFSLINFSFWIFDLLVFFWIFNLFIFPIDLIYTTKRGQCFINYSITIILNIYFQDTRNLLGADFDFKSKIVFNINNSWINILIFELLIMIVYCLKENIKCYIIISIWVCSE